MTKTEKGATLVGVLVFMCSCLGIFSCGCSHGEWRQRRDKAIQAREERRELRKTENYVRNGSKILLTDEYEGGDFFYNDVEVKGKYYRVFRWNSGDGNCMQIFEIDAPDEFGNRER